jgi:WbqC-like protein family
MKTVLFSTAYFPPVSYMASWVSAETVYLEAHEHFVKQTYRNRTSIYGANGKLNLVIPVHHGDLYTQPISQVRFAEDSSWKKIHWRSIESAYRNSPFFEYYETEIKAVFDRPETLLFHWNLALLECLCRLMGIPGRPLVTVEFLKHPPDPVVDLRNSFLPKHVMKPFQPYSQVFQPSHGFIGNLSVLDLLFNLGRESKNYLLGQQETD